MRCGNPLCCYSKVHSLFIRLLSQFRRRRENSCDRRHRGREHILGKLLFRPRFGLGSRYDEAVLSLAARAFLFVFLPVSLALLVSFVTLSGLIRNRMRDGFRESLRQTERSLASADSKYSERQRQLVATLGQNCAACHKQLGTRKEDGTVESRAGALREFQISPRSRIPSLQIMETQLREWREILRDDLLVVADRQRRPVAGFIGRGEGARRLDFFTTAFRGRDSYCSSCHTAPLLNVGGTLYDAITVPIHVGAEDMGSLTVGQQFDVASLSPLGNAAIVSKGSVLLTTFPATLIGEMEAQLRTRCRPGGTECEVEIGGETYLALRVNRANAWGDYQLFSFQSLDRALGGVTRGLRRTFVGVGLSGVVLALLLSALASRSLGKPIAELIQHLKESEQSGQLRPGFRINTSAREVNLLGEALNGAAKAVGESQARLELATVEFVESLAQALDTRDHYTAGHSDRVSANSVAIAQAMGLPEDQIETIRIAAKFHDIGKIGIPDAILSKPGALTKEEFAIMQLHPQMGKRILEKVEHFRPYLPIVELHHENQDGTGYPYGLRGEEIPLSVRIVHVADVYDALSSERPYRKALPDEEACELLATGSGTQFDPEVVRTWLAILHQRQLLQRVLEDTATVNA